MNYYWIGLWKHKPVLDFLVYIQGFLYGTIDDMNHNHRKYDYIIVFINFVGNHVDFGCVSGTETGRWVEGRKSYKSHLVGERIRI